MQEQLTLDGFEPGGRLRREPRPKATPKRSFSDDEAHGFFLGIYPPGWLADSLAALGAQLRGEHGLKGRPRPKEVLHVTLLPLGRSEGPNEEVQQLIETVMTGAAMLDHAPFEARFDGVMSFGRGEGRKPLVAVGGEGLAGMIAFQQALCVSLERAGLPMAPRAQFKPHITLLYDDAAIEPRAIEPITWTVGEFFLVHSRIGETRHELIRRWPLRAAGGTPQAQ